MRRLVIIAAGVVMITLGATAAEAAVSSPYSQVDPQDAPAHADILSIKVKHESTVKLSARIRKPTNPKTSAHWIKGFSNLDWEINVDGDSDFELFAVMSNSNGKLRGIVDFVDQPLPPAECGKSDGVKASFENGSYKLEFPRSCLGNPASFSVQPFMFYDRKPYLPGQGVEDQTDTSAVTPQISPG